MAPKVATPMHLSTPLSSGSKIASAPRQSELLQIHNMLTLAYHRNKNQHRRSRWWKELGVLRRNLKRVLAVEGEGDGNGRGIKHDNRIENEKEVRIVFLKQRVLPRCWIAFSGLVADNQHAALGLMLLGTLGQLGGVLGLDMEEREGFDEKGDAGEEGTREENMAELKREGSRGGEDLGVPLAREQVLEIDETLVMEREKKHARSEGEAAVAETGELPAKKKRKKKHRDAIDELFSGLI